HGRANVNARLPMQTVIVRNGDLRMGITGLVGWARGSVCPILSLVNKVDVPISVDRDRWIACADDRVIRAAVTVSARVRNRPNVPGDTVILRDNHRLFCPGLMEWNRSAATNVRHINGAVFRRDLDVAVESSAIIDRIQGERRPEGETAILTHRRARIGDAL